MTPDLDLDLEDGARLYMNTGDGRALWRMVALLHAAGRPLPQNLFAKLAQWAARVQAAETDGELLQALELAGDRKTHRGRAHLGAYERRWRLASQVHALMALDGRPKARAIEDIARATGETIAAVKSAHYEVFIRRPAQPRQQPKQVSLADVWR